MKRGPTSEHAGAPQRGEWGGGSQPTAMMPPVPRGRRRSAGARAVEGAKARQARLVLGRVDPWSVMKLSFLLAIALAIVTLVAVSILWSVLDSMGVFDSRRQDRRERHALE